MKSDIKVYTSSSCIHCENLKSWLRENSIEFSEMDVERNPEYQLELLKHKALGVPFTIIETNEKNISVLGFNIEKLKKNLLDY